MFDVRHCGWGAGRAVPGPATEARSPGAALLVVEKRAHPVPRGGVQGRRVERRDRRALFSERSSASSRTCAAHTSRSSGCATSSPTATTATSRTRVELGPPCFPPVPSFQLDRGRLENTLLRTSARIRRRGRSTAAACERSSSGDVAHRIDVRRRRRQRATCTADGSLTPAAAPAC